MEPCTGWRQNLEVCLKGVGGSRVKILLCDNLIGSEKLEYILPGTFNRIEKAFLLAEILCRKVGTYAQFSGYSCRKYPKKMDFQNIRKLTFCQNSQTWPFFLPTYRQK